MNTLDEAIREAWRRECAQLAARAPRPEEFERALAPEPRSATVRGESGAAEDGLGSGALRPARILLAPLCFALAAVLVVALLPVPGSGAKSELALRIAATWPEDANRRLLDFADSFGVSSGWGRHGAPKDSP